MWAQIFKDVTPKSKPSETVHEPCHFDNWERPSDLFAPNRKEIVLTDWPTSSNSNNWPNASESSDEEYEEDENSSGANDEATEYDKYWDSDSEAGEKEVQHRNSSSKHVKNEEYNSWGDSDDDGSKNNRNQKKKLKEEKTKLKEESKKLKEESKKVPLFKYPPAKPSPPAQPLSSEAQTSTSNNKSDKKINNQCSTSSRKKIVFTESKKVPLFKYPTGKPSSENLPAQTSSNDKNHKKINEKPQQNVVKSTEASSAKKTTNSGSNSWSEDSDDQNLMKEESRVVEKAKSEEVVEPINESEPTTSKEKKEAKKKQEKRKKVKGMINNLFKKYLKEVEEPIENGNQNPKTSDYESFKIHLKEEYHSWSDDSNEAAEPEPEIIGTKNQLPSKSEPEETTKEQPKKIPLFKYPSGSGPKKAEPPSEPSPSSYIEKETKNLSLETPLQSQSPPSSVTMPTIALKKHQTTSVAFSVIPSNSSTISDKNSEEEDVENEANHSEQMHHLFKMEFTENVFTPFYPNKRPLKSTKTPQTTRPSSFTHSQAIVFAAKSHLWKDTWDRSLPILPSSATRVIDLPESEPNGSEVFAFYRVLAERQQKYILISCNVNVHGYHRGDLRFLEVNSKTKLKGFKKSLVGNLFLGDILAVTELARSSHSKYSNNDFSVSSVTQDTNCFWVVSKATLFPRTISPVGTFSFVKNRMAVVKGDDEPMRVLVGRWETVEVDSIYSGTAFRPMKMDDNFSPDYKKKSKSQVIFKNLKIATYPSSFGTIFDFEECEEQNEEFQIGIKAFSSTNDLDKKKREKIVETCSLMGFSAANTIFNGRFDCRAFHMQDIRKMGLTVKFRIENPPNNPTLGLWNAGNRVLFGGPIGDVNATIETVILENGQLKITSRMSRDCPRNMSFDDGEYYVSQRELAEPYFLYDGYFQDMTEGTNGKRIIQTLYGGPPLEVLEEPVEPDLFYTFEAPGMVPEKEESSDPEGQYYFPSIPERLPLNQYQNEYVQMLLDGNPLVIGSSPFGCGKSMTIITAALEIYKRNSARSWLNNQSHQLLITQSNFASVNLIEITKRICSSKDSKLKNLRFARYVSEKNWNELSEHCRTDHDMPHLMKEVFLQWARGEIEESDRRLQKLQTHHIKQMVAFLLKNTSVAPQDFVGPARRVYEKSPDHKTVFSTVVTEAFFILYQPDIIMTTADSSKNMLQQLKQVSTVQIDEASQLPEYTLLGLLKTFERANFGLIGDIHQLPPYCEETLDGRLKEFGIGNTMERAIQEELFPISTLRYVYRCHPKTTELLSELFYGGKLLSGVSEAQRDEFMRRRSDFWPNPNFPMMIVNHTGNSFKMGTSTGNQSEKQLVGSLVQVLLNHKSYRLKAEDIGVISFYSAQTSILTEHLRASQVKCGTVDAFQGTEKEVIIVCCTNSAISEFMQDKNRLNVALSRAKQATIIVGNLERLRQAKYWSAIVRRAEAYGNVLDSQRPPSAPQPPKLVKNPYYMGNPPAKPTVEPPRNYTAPPYPRRNRKPQEEGMQGRWNSTTYSYRRSDNYNQ